MSIRTRVTRLLLWVTLAGAVVAALILHAPHAHATPTDTYLNCVRQHAPISETGDANMVINLGIRAQNDERSGVSMSTIVANLEKNWGQPADVATAVTLCAALASMN